MRYKEKTLGDSEGLADQNGVLLCSVILCSLYPPPLLEGIIYFSLRLSHFQKFVGDIIRYMC